MVTRIPRTRRIQARQSVSAPPHNRRNKPEFCRISGTEEIEIATFIALQDMIHIKLGIAAQVRTAQWTPVPETFGNLVPTYQHIELALGEIQPNRIAVLHNRKRPTHSSFRATMENYGSIACSAHPRITDPDHVCHTRLLQPLRDGNGTPFRHSRHSFGPAVLENQH